MLVSWLNLYGYAISQLGRSALGGRVWRAVERLTGAILIGLGIRLVLGRTTR